MKTKILLGIAAASLAFAQQGQQEQNDEEEQQYAGPSILSRDKSLISDRGGKLLDFRYYGSITGVYDSGLSGVSIDPTGGVPSLGSFGTSIGFGVVGSHARRRDKISLEYHGSYRHYTNEPYFDGTDQFLNLNYSRLLSRHVTLDIRETAGTTTLSNGYYNYLPLTNTDLLGVPTNELFDNTTRFSQTRADVTWQKTARLSFRVGGDGFLVRRGSLGLAGLNGYRGSADVAYRLTRRQTVSLNYGYTHFGFQNFFGDSNLQSVGIGYGIGLSRKWDFSSAVGGYLIHTLGLETVTLDPAVAAVVGVQTATVTSARTIYAPMFQGRFIRRFNKSALNFGYSMGAIPGNGVYLTSRQNAGTVSYSYVGYRRMTAGLSMSYGTITAVGQTLGQYSNLQGGGGLTYRLLRDTHLTARYDYRHYTTQNSFYQKDSNRFSLGIAYSPGDRPLAIW